MATMITTECINCGACEPECPNNAISQGETIFVIDPKLCTECVGFHDYEACAAVCPVDCCVTDPNNIESEEVLIARARALHPEIQFGDNFESRFRKGQGKGGEQAVGKSGAKSGFRSGHGGKRQLRRLATRGRLRRAGSQFCAAAPNRLLEHSLRCLKCDKTHDEPVSNFMIGNVIFCPHCHKSMVVRDNLNYHIRTLLKDSYDKWEQEQNAFIDRRERELAEFIEGAPKKRRPSKPTNERNWSGYASNLTPSAKPTMRRGGQSKKARASPGVDLSLLCSIPGFTS